MVERLKLTESLELLRRRFHLKLSKRRGLIISENDLIHLGDKDDISVQNRLERLSILRALLSFGRSKQNE
jgi:hypothetical protein